MSLEEAQEAALDEHNRLRALHEDTEPLELSADLCEEAQVRIWTLLSFFQKPLKAYAELLMEENRFEHADDLDVGENLASATGISETIVDEAKRATKSWYDELEDPGYDFENPGFDGGTGHFTQVNN